MFKQPQVNVNSIGPVGILWAAFIILKVMEVIHWSWWIVVLWPVGLWLGAFLICMFIAVLLLGTTAFGSKKATS